MSNVAGARGSVESFGNYEEIEEAVLATPRGRWFLQEHARRQHSKELTSILDAVDRLGKLIQGRTEPPFDSRIAARIVRAIDGVAPVPEPDPEPTVAPLEARQLKFFRNDEELFSDQPPPGPRAVPPPAAESKGARLTIRRTGEAPLIQEAMAAPHESQQPPPPMPVTAGGPEAVPKRRIVIIRHKAGEEISVPFQEDLAASA